MEIKELELFLRNRVVQVDQSKIIKSKQGTMQFETRATTIPFFLFVFLKSTTRNPLQTLVCETRALNSCLP